MINIESYQVGQPSWLQNDRFTYIRSVVNGKPTWNNTKIVKEDYTQKRYCDEFIRDFNKQDAAYKSSHTYELLRRTYLQRLEPCWELENLRGAARCLSNLGNLAAEQGNFSEVQRYYQKGTGAHSEDSARRRKSRWRIIWGLLENSLQPTCMVL